jgi:DNA repair photolyase
VGGKLRGGGGKLRGGDGKLRGGGGKLRGVGGKLRGVGGKLRGVGGKLRGGGGKLRGDQRRTGGRVRGARAGGGPMTGHTAYDACINPYVGCTFGCAYCYVRRASYDESKAWGYFVRARTANLEQLRAELSDIHGLNVAIGTNTDPYQPVEARLRLTRATLQALAEMKEPVSKVGVFTRSPTVVEDLHILETLPRARVHMTLSPFYGEERKILEPWCKPNSARILALVAMKSRVRRVVNVSPSIPLMSDGLVERFAGILANLGVEEVCIGLTCLYDEVKASLRKTLVDERVWAVWDDPEAYAAWRVAYRALWRDAWTRLGRKETLLIWRDTNRDGWEDLITGNPLPPSFYA